MKMLSVVDWLSGLTVVASGLYLVGLAAVLVFRRPVAERFLAAFASSPRAHGLEMSLRLLVGAGMVRFSPLMSFPGLFAALGWVLIVTSVALLLMPWRWHERFSRWAVPWAVRHPRALAAGALSLGVLVLYGVSGAVT